ncbi:MAG: phosphopantetheine-binding protein [Deltaproteobacteria bacterium]|nr:phosphopantetheine-binding protein [Deltaproteobacteria bacterium]
MTGFERELLYRIVEHLRLEEVDVDHLSPDVALFGQGLELDSIDAIELEIMIEKHYGTSILTSERTRSTFGTLRDLARFLEINKGRDARRTDGGTAEPRG